VRSQVIEDPEPKDKLDAMTATTENVVIDDMVNGPEGICLDWASIEWRQVEADVRRLRQRIFTASQDGDLAKARNLQKLTAPRGALSYPRRSREELEGRFLGLMANLDPKR
jgi:N-terminal domain of reverse transcriptase